MARRKATASENGQGSKTQAVIGYFKEHRKARPAEVSAALAEQGIEVSPAYVSNIKSTSKKRRSGKRKARAAAAATSRPGGLVLDDLKQAKQFAEKLGGVSEAKQALDAWSKLQ